MTDQPAAPARTSKAAIAALVLGVFSCLCLPALPAVICGIIGLVVTGRDPTLRGRGMANSGLALGVVFGFFSMCAIVAMPDFLRDRERMRQSRCRSQLKTIAKEQQALMDGERRYDAEQARKLLEPDPRFHYAVTGADLTVLTSAELRALPPWLPARVGVTGTCPDCQFLAACVGNIDDDPALDVWAISSEELKGLDGDVAKAGELRAVHLADDRDDRAAR